MKPFYVIKEDDGNFLPYDIMKYLVNTYDENSKKKWKYKKQPETFEEFKKYIKSESMYMWWSRCQYEIILSDWPCQKNHEKWDVYKQIEMNLDLITEIFIDNIKNK